MADRFLEACKTRTTFKSVAKALDVHRAPSFIVAVKGLPGGAPNKWHDDPGLYPECDPNLTVFREWVGEEMVAAYDVG